MKYFACALLAISLLSGCGCGNKKEKAAPMNDRAAQMPRDQVMEEQEMMEMEEMPDMDMNEGM